MCGYCFEGYVLDSLLEAQNKDDDFFSQNELFSTHMFESHFLPELVDSREWFAKFHQSSGKAHPLRAWLEINKHMKGDVAYGGSSFPPRLMQKEKLFHAESARYSSIINTQLSAFSKIASAKNYEELAHRVDESASLLISEAKELIREVSANFETPIFLSSGDADTSFPNMKIPAYNIEEHIAFYELPITLMTAVDILLKYEPKADELLAVALHIYPTPAFGSLMMAWQRYVLWNLVKINGENLLIEYGPYMRRELIVYIACKLKHYDLSVAWIYNIQDKMQSLVVELTQSEFLNQMVTLTEQ